MTQNQPQPINKKPKTHVKAWTVFGLIFGLIFSYLSYRLAKMLGANFFTMGAIFALYLKNIIFFGVIGLIIGLIFRHKKLKKFNAKNKIN